MRHMKHLLVAAAMGLGMASLTQASDFKVIANLSVGATSVSAEELKSVFLATRTSLSDGSHVEPVLEKGGASHAAFVKDEGKRQ